MAQDQERYEKQLKDISKQVIEERLRDIQLNIFIISFYFQLASKDALLEKQREMIGATKRLFDAWEQKLPEEET